MYKITELLDLSHTQAGGYLSAYSYPWLSLNGLKGYLRGFGRILSRIEFEEIEREVWVHKSAQISPSACFISPCIVGADTEIRHAAFLRGGVLVGKNCVVGNSTELKNCILFDGAKAPHFNYVGDSILGHNAHFGAGVITANVKSDKSEIVVKEQGEEFPTGLKKFGAVVGDGVEVGCNSVLNPGSIIGKNARIYPLSCIRGVLPENTVFKNGRE